MRRSACTAVKIVRGYIKPGFSLESLLGEKHLCDLLHNLTSG